MDWELIENPWRKENKILRKKHGTMNGSGESVSIDRKNPSLRNPSSEGRQSEPRIKTKLPKFLLTLGS